MGVTLKTSNRVFSHDVTVAILVFQDNKMADMLEFQSSLLFCANRLSFVPVNLHRCWSRRENAPYELLNIILNLSNNKSASGGLRDVNAT